MSRFRFEINVEPKDIPNLDDSHKRDCADALKKVINHVFKYTVIFSVAVMAFFGLYSLFGFTYLLRMEKMLPQINLFMPLLALAAFILEFIAGTMNKPALIIEVILDVLLIFSAVLIIPTVWVVPFAAYAVFLHIKLISLLPFHKILSEQEGYPEFTPLPARNEIVSKKETSDNAARNEAGAKAAKVSESSAEEQ